MPINIGPNRVRPLNVRSHHTRALLAAVGLITTLAIGSFGASPAAWADQQESSTQECVQPGPTLRYLVTFPMGTAAQDAEQKIGAACGTITTYYPQIAVGVATSPDPQFAELFGVDQAYSAQGAILAAGQKTEPAAKQSGSASVQQSVTDHDGVQWDMAMIRADKAHEVTLGDSRVVVGVLDSGIDPTHPALTHALDPALSVGCVGGSPNQDGHAWQPTTSPHGTHVAGIIAAMPNSGQGVTGVAPGVRIASIKVVDDKEDILPEAAVCGLMWAASHHMAVTNNSYVTDPWLSDCADKQVAVRNALSRAVTYAKANGVVTVAAASNSPSDLTKGQKCAFPAQLPNNVVTVSSVGANKIKPYYSAYGLGAIDVTAPGGDPAQLPQSSDQGCVLSTLPGDKYGYMCGTSMAVPHVVGVLALLASTHRDATPDELVSLLKQQATPVECPSNYDLHGTGTQDAYCYGYDSYNGFYGHGLVDALKAVNGK